MTIAVAWALAIVVATVDALALSAQAKLTIVGAVLEAVGLILLASDLVFEPLWRLAVATRDRAVATALLVRGLLTGRDHRYGNVNVQAGVAVGTATTSGVALKITPGSVGDRVAELEREFRELRNRLADAEQKQDRDMAEVRSELKHTRDELVDAIRTAIEESRSEYFVLRIAGFGIALTGATVLAVANLAS